MLELGARDLCDIRCLYSHLVDTEERRHDRDNECSNHSAYENDGCWPSNAGELVDLFRKFRLVELGATQGDRIERTHLLADAQHARSKRRHELGFLECIGQAPSPSDAI